MDNIKKDVLQFFLFFDSVLAIYNSSFENIKTSCSLMKISNNENFIQINKKFHLLENVSFANIILINGNDNLFTIEKAGDIKLTNVMFKNVSYNENLIYFSNIYGKIILNSILFQENFVFSHLISLEHCANITISNIIGLRNNINHFDTLEDKLKLGGFIKIANVLYKQIVNASVIDSSSGTSAFGIKIIDDASRNCPSDFISKVCFF